MTDGFLPPGLRLVRVLGRGPLTTVLLCRDEAGGLVVVKRMADPTPDAELALGALKVEAHLRSTVVHPGVLPVSAVHQSPTGPQLVSRYLADGALAAHLGPPLSHPTALEVIGQVADALDEVHRHGWLVADLGAANVLCEWSAGRFLLADLGAAQREHARPPARRQLGARGCAPEVLAGLPATRAADVFALSRLADACLPAGRPPGVAAVLAGGTDPRPERRPASAGELAAALREAWPAQPSPLTRPAGGVASRPAAVAGLAERLAALEDTLTPAERAALRSVLDRAERSVARAVSAMTALTVAAFGRAEALAAFEEAGLAHALAAGPLTAAQAARCRGLAVGPTATVLDLMTALSVVARSAEPGAAEPTYRLAPPFAALYAGDDGRTCRPIAEARQFWAELPHWLHTGTAPAPMDDDRTGTGYRDAASVLGGASLDDARVLAGLLAGDPVIAASRWIVDVGAGSGVWSRSLLAVAPAARLLLLDRPQVLRAADVPPGSALVAADWSALPLAPDSVDVAVLANVCHLEDGAGAAALLGRVAGVLRPAGRLVLVDTIGDDLDQGALLQSMHLGLRTRRGRVHPESSYLRWLAQAGLTVLGGHRLGSGFSARVAARTGHPVP